jgi:3-oxoacyl-[acyl-carrier protein] reductase
MEKNLCKKKVLIVGGAGDIGLKIAEVLIEEDASVILTYNNSFERAIAFKEIADKKRKCVSIIKCDLCDLDNIKKLNFEGITSIVFCSGNTCLKPIFDCTYEEILQQYSVEVFGPLLIIKKIIKNESMNNLEEIIFISSVAGINLNASSSAYGLAKSGVIALNSLLSKELYSRGIRVNCIAPGLCNTRMGEKVATNKGSSIKLECKKRIDKSIVSPSEIAELCKFMLSNNIKHMNGQVIQIDSLLQ